jgi:hypothetical protein
MTLATTVRGSILVILLMCSFHTATSQPGHKAQCGPLVRWRLPALTRIDSVPGENRDHSMLMTQARLNAIIVAAEAYCRNSGGAYPASLEEMLMPSPSAAAKLSRCRLEEHMLVDGWDDPIFYAVVDGRVVLRSAGADKRFSTRDDVGRPVPSDQHSESFTVAAECM